MDDGSLLKDYAEKEKETEQAIQMAVRQVAFEDERYLVRLFGWLRFNNVV